MIITLTRADFSSCKIGTLTTFNVRKSTVIGASVNIIKTSVERAGYSSATTIATIVLDEANYEGHAIKVMMGSTDVSSWYSLGNVIVPANTPITSNITISVSATAVVPDIPVTPTMYTFTINPTPTNATVTLTASGYTQSGKSITVPANTVVTWKVSATGFTEQNGTHTVTKTESKNVTLSATGGGDTNLLSTLQFSAPSDMSYDNTQYKLTSSNTVSSIISDGAAKQWILSNVPIGKGKEVEFDIVMTGTNGFYTFGLTPSNDIANIGDSCIYTKTHPILCGFPNFYYDYGNQVKNGDKFQCFNEVPSETLPKQYFTEGNGENMGATTLNCKVKRDASGAIALSVNGVTYDYTKVVKIDTELLTTTQNTDNLYLCGDGTCMGTSRYITFKYIGDVR